MEQKTKPKTAVTKPYQMKNIYFLFSILFSSSLVCQSYTGYITDNFNGIHGVTSNPANIADSRVQIDVNFISFSTVVANDYVGFSFDNVTQLADGADFTDLNTFASSHNEVLANLEVMGPSFMFNLSEKHSVGILTRARLVNNYNNINGEFLESILDGFPTEDYSVDQDNLDGTTHGWGEIGLAYGRVIFDDFYNHYLKGGITLKYLLGGGVAQGSSNNLSGSYTAADNQINFNGDFSYLMSYDEDQDPKDYIKNYSPGYGMDLGVVYEYRTPSSMASNTRDNQRAINKYRVKIGMSLQDLGAITYKDVEFTKYDLNGTVDADEVEDDFVDALDNNFSSTNTLGDVRIALPTSLRLNIDYKLLPLVYANLDITQTVVKKNAPYNNNRLNLITFTPRFETRIISAYLPISYSPLGKTAIGAGLKLGPLIVGSGSLLSNLISDSPQMVNVYFGFKIPISHRR